MFNKNKFKGGLLSDIVSPEVLEEMTASEENTENKNTEAKPAEENTNTETTPAADDASWKSKVSAPASENTDDGNQKCGSKKSSNQSEYAEEIGLVEVDIDESLPSENIAVDMVDGLEDALEATDEIIEQKMIMDEAAAAGNLSVLSVAIFKENAEKYMSKMNGENNGKFDGKYLDPDNSGLQSDNPESLRAGLQGVWDSVIQTVQGVIDSLDRASLALKNVFKDISSEIEIKFNKEFYKLVWIPFRKSIESNVEKNKSFKFSKSKINSFIGSNYSSAKLLLSKDNIEKADFIKLVNEVIDYYKEDKLPEVTKNDKSIEVSLKSMGSRGELEKAAVDFILASIKKGDDGKSIFREIFNARDKLMIKGTTTDGISKSISSKGHSPDEIKPEQIRAYALSNKTVYAIVFSKDGKNYLHDFVVNVPYNYILGRSENTQAREDIELDSSEMKKLIAKVEEAAKALNISSRGKQKTKINQIDKILKDDILELKEMVSKSEFTNWKLWKQHKQNTLSISRVYPQMVRLSGFGLLKHAVETGRVLASASSIKD